VDLLTSLAEQFNLYLLVVIRISGIIAGTPIFGARNVPAVMKVGLVLLTSLFMQPVATVQADISAMGLAELALFIANELLIGLAMGFILSLAFMFVQVAGQLMDVPMGFSMVNVLDPLLGQQVPILGQFQYAISVIVFLSINGHHLILKALADSFALIPLGGWSYWPGLTEIISKAFTLAFTLGLQIALPVVAVLLIVDISLGLIARTVPQMNVFILGFPLKIIIGLVFVMLLLPMYVIFMENVFSPSSKLFEYLRAVLGGNHIGA